MHLSFKLCSRIAAAFGLVFIVLSHPVYAKLSMTLPVEGEVQHGTETFSGMATVFFSGDGSMTLTTSLGVTCTGEFINANRREGSGTVVCEDGRSGSFDFVTFGFSGFGTGLIATVPFAFRIGK
jgi:hypothetical protein